MSLNSSAFGDNIVSTLTNVFQKWGGTGGIRGNVTEIKDWKCGINKICAGMCFQDFIATCLGGATPNSLLAVPLAPDAQY